MAHPGGRPPKYKKEFCQMLVKHMSEGLSFKSFGAEIDVCEETLHEWCRSKPQFSESKRVGRQKQEYFYEKFGRSAMAGKVINFNATAFVWMTKNMLGWREKQEIEHSGELKNPYSGLSKMELIRLAQEEIQKSHHDES